MPGVHALKKSKQGVIVKLSFILLFSIPLIVLGLSSKESFDTRRRAFEDLKVSELNPCIISLPNVNPYSLEVGKTVRVSVDAKLTNDGISGLQITDSTGASIYKESFSENPNEIATTFEFTPKTSGVVDILGILTKESGKSVGCKISSPYDVKGLRAISNNSSPEFTSSPSSSQPSQDIKVGQSYEYTLTAVDADKDRINYSYSFTPRAEWLKEVVLEDGSNGSLKIKFKGTPNKPASYLAYVLIHDGYSSHVHTQSWIISAGQNENDIPKIKIVEPTIGLRINQGETFKTSWQATDLNHISRYNIFMTTNPSDESKWVSVEKNLPYNTDRYNITTQNLKPGTYNLVIQATDNQTPAKTGFGVSPEIVISKVGGTSSNDDKQGKVDDQVFISQPQVTNMSPSSTDKITYFKPTVKATIVASDNEKINQESILFKIDNKDVSKSVKINRISDKEFTILYQPSENLSGGEHKIELSFSDTAKKSASKSWTFEITDENSTKKSGNVDIFGYLIPQKTVIIIVVGVAILSLAILAPFIISSIWKSEKDPSKDIVSLSNKIAKAEPTETEMFIISNADKEDIRQKVETSPVEKEKEVEKDKWNNFSAPLLTEEEKSEQTLQQKEDSQKLDDDNIMQQAVAHTPKYGSPEEIETKSENTTLGRKDEDILQTIPGLTEAPQKVVETPKYEPSEEIETTPESSNLPKEDDNILQTIPGLTEPPQEVIDIPKYEPVEQSKTDYSKDILESKPEAQYTEDENENILNTIPNITPPQTVVETPIQQPIPTQEPESPIQPPQEETQPQESNQDVVIEEPEAPAPEDLQKIFEQIQKTSK